jgi:hypothetical protein
VHCFHHIGFLGYIGIFQRRAEGHGHPGRAHPPDRRIQVTEGFLGNHRGHLAAKAAAHRRFVHDQKMAGLLHGRQDGILVERLQLA